MSAAVMLLMAAFPRAAWTQNQPPPPAHVTNWQGSGKTGSEGKLKDATAEERLKGAEEGYRKARKLHVCTPECPEPHPLPEEHEDEVAALAAGLASQDRNWALVAVWSDGDKIKFTVLVTTEETSMADMIRAANAQSADNQTVAGMNEKNKSQNRPQSQLKEAVQEAEKKAQAAYLADPAIADAAPRACERAAAKAAAAAVGK